MNAAELIKPPPTRSTDETRSATPGSVSAQAFSLPTFHQRLEEIVPLIGFVPVAGPPAIFIAGPWLLFVLMLVGPFVLLVTLAAIALCVTVLLGLTGAILATPYLLVRRLQGRRGAHAASPPLVHRLAQDGPVMSDRPARRAAPETI